MHAVIETPTFRKAVTAAGPTDDEVFAMTSNGGVIRTTAAEIKQSGRQTMGVRLMNLAEGDSVVAIARTVESMEDADTEADEGSEGE